MFDGTYKIYKNGEFVAESKNQLTIAGRAIMLKALLGLVPSIGGTIQAGIDGSANIANADGLIDNTRLGFSITSSPVYLSYLDNPGNYDALVFKTTIPGDANSGNQFTIYELGLYPGVPDEIQGFYQTSLFSGSFIDNWKNSSDSYLSSYGAVTSAPANSGYVSSFTGYSFRVGDTALYLKTSEIIKQNEVSRYSSLGSYGSEDYVSIAYSKLATVSALTLTVKFLTSTDTPPVGYQLNYTLPTTAGYGIISVKLSDAILLNSPSGWNSIKAMSMSCDGDVVIDAIRFNDNDNIDTNTGLISRTALSTPIVKNTADTLDIEYYLSVGFNKTVTP